MTLGHIWGWPFVWDTSNWTIESWELKDGKWVKLYPEETEADKQLREAQQRKATLEKQKEQRRLDAAKHEQIAKLKAEIAALEAELK